MEGRQSHVKKKIRSQQGKAHIWKYKDTHRKGIHFLLSLLFSRPAMSDCDPLDSSTSGLPVPLHLLKFAQVHVHCIGDANHPSHPLTLSSPSALNLSQHQGLFQ